MRMAITGLTEKLGGGPDGGAGNDTRQASERFDHLLDDEPKNVLITTRNIMLLSMIESL